MYLGNEKLQKGTWAHIAIMCDPNDTIIFYKHILTYIPDYKDLGMDND